MKNSPPDQPPQAHGGREAAVLEHLPHMAWRCDANGARTWSSAQWRRFTGQEAEQSLGWGWLAAIHPDDRQRATQACVTGGEGERVLYDVRIWNSEDGRHRRCQAQSIGVGDEAGRVGEWYGDAADFDELYNLQGRQQALVNELQHRVRNILAVVRSIARRTAATATSVEDFAAHLEGRINALARTQTVLARSTSGGADLETMVAEELLAHAAQDIQLRLEGPSVHVPAGPAETLGLAIHELAANAIKYGALSQPGAALAISWTIDTQTVPAVLTLTWRESGVAVAAPAPRARGFGFELLERSLPYELGAKVDLRLLPGGLSCRIATPLPPASTTTSEGRANG